MHFARLVKQASVDLTSDLFVYYRLGMSQIVFVAYMCPGGLLRGSVVSAPPAELALNTETLIC